MQLMHMILLRLHDTRLISKKYYVYLRTPFRGLPPSGCQLMNGMIPGKTTDSRDGEECQTTHAITLNQSQLLSGTDSYWSQPKSGNDNQVNYHQLQINVKSCQEQAQTGINLSQPESAECRNQPEPAEVSRNQKMTKPINAYPQSICPNVTYVLIFCTNVTAPFHISLIINNIRNKTVTFVQQKVTKVTLVSGLSMSFQDFS